MTTVPLPTNIQAEDIVKIINEAQLTCLTCSLGELPNLAHLVGDCETVKTFVVMDLPSQIDPEAQVLMKKVRGGLLEKATSLTNLAGPLCMPWPPAASTSQILRLGTLDRSCSCSSRLQAC